ncbi:MAG: hypothetical protein J6D12_06085, partial [Peptostreptococcaceae bacterium]|nr:hypothetical protein [Peptostreptococcaceae bacterium]
NNVATVTTPSTLTDDTLRLTGKGVTASRVRLLEGDKTNWIPSYFEGMKSCFEDKLQDDGTYKIEITSTNTDNTLSNKIQLSSIEPLRGVGDVKDRFVFKDGKLMIERSCSIREYQEGDYELSNVLTDEVNTVYILDIKIYEEIPFELQKIILEGYENGTLFFDTNIPPTVTTTYAGETPIVKATKLNKTEVLKNTDDINDNIVPYLMDMDFRVVCLQLEGGIENVSMARLFGGTFEMLRRDIQSKRYSKEEYKYRLDAYLSANKITEDEYEKLGDMLNE